MGLGNKFAIRALIGLVLGMIVGVGTWIIRTGSLGEADYAALVLHLVVSGLIGFIGMGGAVVYEIESWPLLKATGIHYIACMVSFILAAVMLSWFSDFLSFFITLMIMTIIYACIWIGESLYWKKTIDEINRQLNNIER